MSKKIFRLHDLAEPATVNIPYQHFLKIEFYSEEMMFVTIMTFLTNYTDCNGSEYGGIWWFSEFSNRIYFRNSELPIILLKFGEYIFH